MKWKIEKLHGRSISTRNIEKDDPQSLRRCADCNCNTTKIIIELEGITRKDNVYPYIWGWCGKCDIG